MRDINRIKTIIEKLEELWLANPDYRLGQLIMVIAMSGETNTKLFYLEDDKMLELIEERIKQMTDLKSE